MKICKRGHQTEAKASEWCLTCKRELGRRWRAAHAEWDSERHKRYRKADPERYKEEWRRKYAATRETYLAKRRLAYAANPKKKLDAQRRYRAANPLAWRETIRRWRLAHPEKRRAENRESCRRRKARKLCAPIHDAHLIQVMARDLYQGACVYCGHVWTLFSKQTLDHQRALAGGGSHAPENIVPCCQSCNSSKNDRDVDAWLSERYGAKGRDRLMVWAHKRHWWLEERRVAA